ncbi:CHAD domain-containing protein [Halomonas sp. QHL1]|uniref:CHAD domain-containing protein n=1 Tax=Halomonas sp. QHL1 TaxID=1123773 RepID=UPI0008FD0FFF|nr:CHAD domain-containing protein [Halomonas sp. QHL1]OJA04252.1 hypothetical protein QHL1GM_01910 [Halomonas sp. QHL1]
MRHLYVMRHAKAKQPSGNMTDHQRPLRKRGRHQAAAMAPVLQRWQALAGEVYVSTTVRTRETFDEILKQLPEANLVKHVHFDEALYTFDGEALMAWLKTLPNKANRVLVIGHNPALLDLASWLCEEAPHSLPTGSMLHFSLPDTLWAAMEQGCAELVDSLTPKEASYPFFQRLDAPKPPDQCNAETASHIRVQLEHQYLTVRALEAGVIAGVDPEFLHQYRVNLRRSRAVGEAVLSTTKVPGLKKMLKRLKHRANATSDLRDLDVFLKHLSKSPPQLSARARQGLKQWLQGCRQEQHEALCQQLNSLEYAEELQGWQTFLASNDFGKALSKLTPKRINAVLSERMADHDNDLAALSLDAGDTPFHTLRKRVKRIRYLADLNPATTQLFLSELKRRQSLLGNYQDLCTRQAWIEAFAESPDSDAEQKLECDAWRASLEAQKQRLREDVLALKPLANDEK